VPDPVWYWIDLTLWSTAPFVAIIVGNAAIVVRLMRAGELRGGVDEPSHRVQRPSPTTAPISFHGRWKTRSMSSSASAAAAQTSRSSAVSGRSRRVTSSTAMLLVVSLVFLVTNSPMVVCMLGYEAWLSRASSLPDIARLRLLHGACDARHSHEMTRTHTGNLHAVLLHGACDGQYNQEMAPRTRNLHAILLHGACDGQYNHEMAPRTRNLHAILFPGKSI